MEFPKNYKYTKDHEWIETQGSKGTVGVTAYAGDSFGTIESTKTVSDLYMPVTGKILEVNSALKTAPESLQADAYKIGWLVRIEMAIAADASGLLDANSYEAFIKE